MNYSKQEFDSMLEISDNATEKQSHKTLKSSVDKRSYLKLKSK